MTLFQRYKYEVILGIILAVFIAFQWQHLSSPYFWDELAYYAKASLFMHDNGLSLLPNGLPPDLSRGHPLLFQFLSGSWLKIFGTSLLTVHCFSLCISLFLIIITFYSSREVLNSSYALLVCIFLLLQPLFLAQSILILPEILLTLFTFISIYFLLKDRTILFLLFSTLSILTKELGVITSIVGFIYFYINCRSFKSTLIASIPILVYALFLVIQKIQNGWFFFPFHVSLIETNPFNILQKIVKSCYFIFIAQGRFILLPFIIIQLVAFIRSKNIIKIEQNITLILILTTLLCIVVNSSYHVMNRYYLQLFPCIIILTILGVKRVIISYKINWSFSSILLIPSFFFMSSSNRFNMSVDWSYRNTIKATQKTYNYLVKNKYYKKNGFCHFSILRAFGDSRLGYNTDKKTFSLQEEKSLEVEYAIEINPIGWDRDMSYWKGFKLVKQIKEGNFEVLIFKK